MKHRVCLSFLITDYEDINHEEITQQLGINPSKVYIKSTVRNPYSSPPILWKFNRWIMYSPLYEHASFEDQMNSMLDILEPKIDLLKPFCQKYRCEFLCAIYVYPNSEESTPWVQLNNRYNNLIKELDIEFDFDLYVQSVTKSE